MLIKRQIGRSHFGCILAVQDTFKKSSRVSMNCKTSALEASNPGLIVGLPIRQDWNWWNYAKKTVGYLPTVLVAHCSAVFPNSLILWRGEIFVWTSISRLRLDYSQTIWTVFYRPSQLRKRAACLSLSFSRRHRSKVALDIFFLICSSGLRENRRIW